jgi:hypothetical protein
MTKSEQQENKQSKRSFTKTPEAIQRYRDSFDERTWPPKTKFD